VAEKQSSKRKVSTVMNVLTVSDVDAAKQFYMKAFGFAEAYPNGWGTYCPPGLNLKESTIMLVPEPTGKGSHLAAKMLPVGEKTAKELGPLPLVLYITVADVDKVITDAVKLGATAKGTTTDMLWGDRCGTVMDPFGYTWMIATHVSDPTPVEIAQKVKELRAKP
jgi:PhnB protein